MNAKDVIKKAWAYLQDPECWTKNTLARTEDGSHCDILSRNVKSLCILGALIKYAQTGDQVIDAINLLLPEAKGIWNLAAMNDSCKSHEEFIRLFEPLIMEATKQNESELHTGSNKVLHVRLRDVGTYDRGRDRVIQRELSKL